MDNIPSLKLHKLYLQQFWRDFADPRYGRLGSSLKSKEETLEALIRLGEVRLFWKNARTPEKNRDMYNKIYKKRRKYNLFKRCFACRGPAQCRHHIIWIRNGGRNDKKNIVALCNPCHAEIHPWLKR